jgi:integrase
MVDDLYVRLRRSGGAAGQPLAPGTVARVRVVLHAALAQAMQWGWIWDNPAERAARLTTPTAEQYPPTPAEVARLLDHVAADDPSLHVLLVLAATAGARRAELLALRWRSSSVTTASGIKQRLL